MPIWQCRSTASQEVPIVPPSMARLVLKNMSAGDPSAYFFTRLICGRSSGIDDLPFAIVAHQTALSSVLRQQRLNLVNRRSVPSPAPYFFYRVSSPQRCPSSNNKSWRSIGFRAKNLQKYLRLGDGTHATSNDATAACKR